jgi:hypothetical protein
VRHLVNVPPFLRRLVTDHVEVRRHHGPGVHFESGKAPCALQPLVFDAASGVKAGREAAFEPTTRK